MKLPEYVSVGLIIALGLTALGAWYVSTKYRTDTRRWLITGLKAVDLFTPIERGSDVLITGDPKSGATVLGTEIAYRYVHDPSEKLRVLYYHDESLSDIQTRLSELAETLPALTEKHSVAAVNEETLRSAVRSADGKHVVVFVASKSERFLQLLRESLRRFRVEESLSKQLTAIVVTELIDYSDVATKIFSSQKIASQGIYPAIDLSRSRSASNIDSRLSTKQKDTLETAKQAIIEVEKALYDGAVKDPEFEFNRDISKRPALQALCYLSQSFFAGELYTGKKGHRMPIKTVVDKLSAILAGKSRDTAVTAFFYME
jgi:hypothetical protein